MGFYINSKNTYLESALFELLDVIIWQVEFDQNNQASHCSGIQIIEAAILHVNFLHIDQTSQMKCPKNQNWVRFPKILKDLVLKPDFHYLGGRLLSGLWSIIKTCMRSGLGNKGKASKLASWQSAVRLPEAHLHLQADGQWLQSPSESKLAMLSPEGVAVVANNNIQVEYNKNIVLSPALLGLRSYTGRAARAAWAGGNHRTSFFWSWQLFCKAKIANWKIRECSNFVQNQFSKAINIL